jgi:hypothetical protein
MSAATVWQGLEERFKTIEGIAAIVLGEPTSIQATPLLYAGYAGATQIARSTAPAHNLDALNHEFAVRIVFEMELLTLADSVPSAINDDPRLAGRLHGGMARALLAFSGYAVVAKKLYRVLDFTVTVIEKAEAT